MSVCVCVCVRLHFCAFVIQIQIASGDLLLVNVGQLLKYPLLYNHLIKTITCEIRKKTGPTDEIPNLQKSRECQCRSRS